jgi:hypothetical protein
LSICIVLVSAFVATLLSGEYLTSWVYLLFDFGEAAFGLAVGLLIAFGLRRSRALTVLQRDHPAPAASAKD